MQQKTGSRIAGFKSVILFHRNAFGQISGLVHIQSFGDAEIISQKLQRHYSQAGGEMLVGLRNVDGEAGGIFNGLVSVGGETHYISTAASAFHQVA